MRAILKTPAVGVAGACGLVVLAVMLLTGTLDLAEAARRAGVLLLAVLLVEHLLLPVARTLVGAPERVPGADAERGPAEQRLG